MGEERAVSPPRGQAKAHRRPRPNIYLPEDLATALHDLAEEALDAPSETLLKISFYLTPAQAEKLDDLAYQYRKHTFRRVNRNDIVRYLIDQTSIDALANFTPSGADIHPQARSEGEGESHSRGNT